MYVSCMALQVSTCFDFIKVCKLGRQVLRCHIVVSFYYDQLVSPGLEGPNSGLHESK